MSAPPRSARAARLIPPDPNGASRQSRRSIPGAGPAMLAILAVIVFVGTVVAMSLGQREAAVAGLFDTPSPSPSAEGAAAPSPSPAQSIAASPSALPTLVASPSLVPTINPTPKPVVQPAPTPRPTPKPTPRPTPTPVPTCTVISLIGIDSNKAQATWAAAGFTGTVSFNPDWPPHYIIETQSRTPGTEVSCTSGITVHGTP